MSRAPLILLAWLALGAAPAFAAGEVASSSARDAAIAMQRGNIDRAVQLYGEALTESGLSNERRAALLNDRGVANARLNRPKPAIEDFNKAAQLYAENATIYNNRGNVLLSLGLDQEAVKDFDRAIVLAPGYAAAYSNRGHAWLRLGSQSAALRDFAKALSLNPQSAPAYAGRGRLHLMGNRPFAAAQDLSRAVAIDGRFAQGYRARAEARLAAEQYEQAIEDLSRAIAFDAGNVDLYMERGNAYLAARNVISAIKDFARAAEIDRRSVVPLEALALANARAEAFDDALNDITRALEVNPRSASTYAIRAVIYKMMKQADVGAKDLERAQRLDAGVAEVAWARGELAEAAGNLEEALAELKKAVAAKPSLKEAQASLDRLSGETVPVDVAVKEADFERWQVTRRLTRHTATHPDLGKLTVPLETMSDAQPRILEWDVKKGAQKGFGVLRYAAGQLPGPKGPEPVEQGVVIDLQTKAILAVLPLKQGATAAEWTWTEAKLTVKSPDGATEEVDLKPKPVETSEPEVAAKETKKQRTAGGDGWSKQWGGEGRRGRQQQPKSLFDLIFKGF